MIKIGLDLDNTIICYDNVFKLQAEELFGLGFSTRGGKEEVKGKIVSTFGINDWMKLQGLVYGKFIHQSSLFAGFLRFAAKAKRNKVELFIVSHKTKFGHFDKSRINLRNKSLEFLLAKGVIRDELIPEKNIFFCETREEKVKKINELQCDVFIDDLPDVIQELRIQNAKIQTIHFCTDEFNENSKDTDAKIRIFRSWRDISYYFFGRLDEDDRKYILGLIFRNTGDTVFRSVSGGNNHLLFYDRAGSKSVIKFYDDDNQSRQQSRMHREVAGYRFTQQIAPRCCPNLIEYDLDYQVIVLEYINGRHPSISTNFIEHSVKFLEKLNPLATPIPSSLELADGAVCSISELFRDIDQRLELLSDECLDVDMLECLARISAFKNHLLAKFEFCNLLEEEIKVVVSPGDFGSHNAIVDESGLIKWIDFEYFGLDSAVKVMYDFYWHPAMNLSDVEKSFWVNLFLNTFDLNFDQKISWVWRYGIGLRWALIVLRQRLKTIEAKTSLPAKQPASGSFQVMDRIARLEEELVRGVGFECFI